MCTCVFSLSAARCSGGNRKASGHAPNRAEVLCWRDRQVSEYLRNLLGEPTKQSEGESRAHGLSEAGALDGRAAERRTTRNYEQRTRGPHGRKSRWIKQADLDQRLGVPQDTDELMDLAQIGNV